MLASGAAVASGTASAAPQAQSAYVMAHHCHKVKGHYVNHNGKKVWVKEHKVCTKK